MKFGARLMIAVLCLFAAVGCYVFGAPAGGLAFLVIGVALEGAFWVLLFRKRSQKP